MVLPEGVDKMSDAALLRWLIKEGDYSPAAAKYVLDVVRGKVNAEDLD